MKSLLNDNRGGISFESLLNLFIIGGIGFYVFLVLWNGIAPDTVTQIGCLQGDNDPLVLLLFYLVPVAVVVRIVMLSLKGSDSQQSNFQ